MSIMKHCLNYKQAKYFKFWMSLDLQVSKFITILRGFQVELWDVRMCFVWTPPLSIIMCVSVSLSLKKKVFVIENKSSDDY